MTRDSGLLAGDRSAGDRQHSFEQRVVPADKPGGVAVERETVHDDMHRAEAVEDILGDREGAVVVQVALVICDREPLQREAACR